MDEKEIRGLTRVYLDTNKWIELARIVKGKNSDTTKVGSKLLDLNNRGEILIPFSSFNFYEITRVNNRRQREEMIDFMVDVSRGWFFKPVSRYFGYEVSNACWKKLGQRKHYDIFPNIITNRADSVLTGDEGKLALRDDHNPTKEEATMIKEAQKTWDKYTTDLVSMKKMFKSEVTKKFAETDMMLINQVTKNIESDRSNDFGISNSMFDKYNRLKYTIAYLNYHVPKFCLHNNVPMEKLVDPNHGLERLVENMPALNVCVELNSIRDKESPERPVARNDYYDILHYATGLSYADVMIGEKMFGSISKRQKLDKKNKCCIYTSFNELYKRCT